MNKARTFPVMSYYLRLYRCKIMKMFYLLHYSISLRTLSLSPLDTFNRSEVRSEVIRRKVRENLTRYTIQVTLVPPNLTSFLIISSFTLTRVSDLFSRAMITSFSLLSFPITPIQSSIIHFLIVHLLLSFLILFFLLKNKIFEYI